MEITDADRAVLVEVGGAARGACTPAGQDRLQVAPVGQAACVEVSSRDRRRDAPGPAGGPRSRNRLGARAPVIENEATFIDRAPRMLMVAEVAHAAGLTESVDRATITVRDPAGAERVCATLIGEPTGQKPNAYGEVRTFTLPHSGIAVGYFAQKDPVLDLALAANPR